MMAECLICGRDVLGGPGLHVCEGCAADLSPAQLSALLSVPGEIGSNRKFIAMAVVILVLVMLSVGSLGGFVLSLVLA